MDTSDQNRDPNDQDRPSRSTVPQRQKVDHASEQVFEAIWDVLNHFRKKELRKPRYFRNDQLIELVDDLSSVMNERT